MADNKTMIDENDEIVTLTFDDGSQEEFYVMAELDYEGRWYSYLVPVDPDDDFDDDEVLVYEIAEGEDGEDNNVYATKFVVVQGGGQGGGTLCARRRNSPQT